MPFLAWITKNQSKLAPIFGFLILVAGLYFQPYHFRSFVILSVIGLISVVLAAVHHAEVIAHRIGEPFGTLTLAISITTIEVGLIISLMLTGGEETLSLARDTVLASVMIITSGIVGLCMLIGGIKYSEQTFKLHGASASLITLTSIVVLTLILPNYTTSNSGPTYTESQLIFIALVSLVLYFTFVFMQIKLHRNYFLDAEPNDANMRNHIHVSKKVAISSFFLLLACLALVVLLAKTLATTIETNILALGAPYQLLGVIIAAIVLMPEGLAAVKAARNNQFQTSLNLAIGSALASIGLTIPAVAALSIITGWTLTLGIDTKSIVLLFLTLFVSGFSITTGRTNILQGVVLLVIFAVYLFTTIVP